jgi:hypothetical protein
VIGTAKTSYLFQPSLQFEARNYGALISLPLAAIFLASDGCRAALLPWTRPAVVATLACLAVGQCGWHAIGLRYWAEFLDSFGEILAGHCGMVSLSEAEAAGLKPISWTWTYPSLSIVLSPNGHVASMIVPPRDVKWQPFDPANHNELPQSRRFDLSAYRDTLVPDGRTPRCPRRPQDPRREHLFYHCIGYCHDDKHRDRHDPQWQLPRWRGGDPLRAARSMSQTTHPRRRALRHFCRSPR